MTVCRTSLCALAILSATSLARNTRGQTRTISTPEDPASTRGQTRTISPPEDPAGQAAPTKPAPVQTQAVPAVEPVRVRGARANATERVTELFAQAKVSYPAQRMLLRSFKQEEELEVWVGDRRGPMVLLTTYPVCAKSGELGPKRRRGDLQVPEGFYRVERFNPTSNFHLSFGVDYPNASDRILGHRADLGGDIFIHGSCVTIGCIPIEDGPIEQLYLMAWDVHRAGRRVHVHIFPRRMTDEGMQALTAKAGEDATLLAFWQNLRPGYLLFEEHHDLPRVRVDPKTGAYRITAPR